MQANKKKCFAHTIFFFFNNLAYTLLDTLPSARSLHVYNL